jgi:hypothetical protein
MPRLLIFTALHLEARPLARKLRLWPTSPTQYIGQRAPDLSIHLHVIGLRAVHLPNLVEQPIAILLGGLAGALDPTLRCGDVIVDEQSAWTGILRHGPIHCAQNIIATAREKSELFRSTGAIAVEMESSKVRQFAQQRAIPFIHVRSISDEASQSLNLSLFGLIDEMGRPRLGAVARMILKEPAMARDLLHMSKQSRTALKSLSTAVEQIVKKLISERP